ncbi:MAG: FAD-binding protein [Gammaproteobacteria bacterium]|nr:FAD-binding protein [Gammaproteobacteria bacterium]
MRTSAEAPVADLPALLAGLAAALPPEALVTAEDGRRAFESDGLTAYRAMPAAVALPESTEQVRTVIDLCRRHGVPVVTRGAGTGLSGGALPVEHGVVLGLSRLNRILEIDPEACTARVQPGVRNLEISGAAAPHGLYYAPDPSSQIACTIGGNVAENSGGVHCLKYGLTVHNILELTVMTIEGETLTIGSSAPDAPGYDLMALMTGSEGMLGVVTEVLVKLLPRPAAVEVLLGAFDAVEDAAAAVAAVIGAGIVPAGLEMMDRLATKVTEEFCQPGYPADAAAILLCELDGERADVAATVTEVEALFRSHGASDVRVAADAAARALFWQGRKAAFPAIGRIAPDYYCMDGTIPRRQLAAVLTAISELSREYQLPIANVFHAGDGNLHPLIAYDASDDDQLHRAEACGARILELCVAAGGTITGEHGVGIEKIDQMCSQFSDAELAQFHRLRAVFDPHGLLNPGKAVPTLSRCSEIGGMHVHGGAVPFPELDRF